MSDLLSGDRHGPFVVLKDDTGLRHAVRQQAILCISEGEAGDTTTLQLTGSRTALVRAAFDTVLGWFR